MLQLYENKVPKRKGNLFPGDSQSKIAHNQKRGSNSTEIKNLKTEDIIFYVDYYKGIKSAKYTKKIDIKLKKIIVIIIDINIKI